MPRINSSNWAVNDQITAARLQDLNEDLDDIYVYGVDRGRVRTAISGTALRIDIAAFAWRVGGSSGQYVGGTNIVVTNTATNYVEIDSTGTIAINTTGWTAANGRLATVTCSGGVVTAISIWKPDVVGGSLGSSFLVNTETLAANKTLSSTDKYTQLLNPNGTARDVTLDTSGMVEGSEFLIKNTDTVATLTVKQSSTVKGYLTPGGSAIFTYDGSNWTMKTDVVSKAISIAAGLMRETQSGGASTLSRFYTTSTIAFDATTAGFSAAGSLTQAHTITGTNPVLLVAFYLDTSSDLATACTWGGVAGTQLINTTLQGARHYLYAFLAPATGTANVVCTVTGTPAVRCNIISYTGASQTILPEAFTTNSAASGTSATIQLTPLTINAWVAMCANNVGSGTATISAGASTTLRGTGSTRNWLDNNAAITTPVATTVTASWTTSQQWEAVGAVIVPNKTSPELWYFDFQPSEQEAVEFQLVMPENYQGGTIKAKLYWTATSGSGDCTWGVQARAYTSADAHTQNFGTAQVISQTLGGSSQIMQTSLTPAITIGGTPLPGKLTAFRIYRDATNAADTLTTNARLIAVELVYS